LENRTRQSPVTLFASPPGYLADGVLAETLSDQGRTVIWLRLGIEDRDPGIFLISLVESARRLNPDIGGQTLEGMRRNPGPIYGWETAYARLAVELHEGLPDQTTFVLEHIDVLNQNPLTLNLLCRFILDKLPNGQSSILIAHEGLPVLVLPKKSTIWKARDLKITSDDAQALAARSDCDLPVEYIRRIVDLTDGRLVALSGIVTACQALGTGFVGRTVRQARDTTQLFSHIAAAYLASADRPIIQAILLALQLHYWHPALVRLAGGVDDQQPTNPWLESLADGWNRVRCSWVLPLRTLLDGDGREDLATVYRVADFLASRGAQGTAVDLCLSVGQYESAAQRIAEISERMLDLGQWWRLENWLNGLPAEVTSNWPCLVYIQGELAAALGKNGAASRAFTRATKLFSRSNDPAGACQSLVAESTLASWNGNRDRAQLCALNANLIAKSAGLGWQQAIASWQLGCLALEAGDLEQALASFIQAQQSVTDFPLKEIFSTAHELAIRKADLHEQIGSYRQSLAEGERLEETIDGTIQSLLDSPVADLPSLLESYGWSHLPLGFKLRPPRKSNRKNELNFWRDFVHLTEGIWNRSRYLAIRDEGNTSPEGIPLFIPPVASPASDSAFLEAHYNQSAESQCDYPPRSPTLLNIPPVAIPGNGPWLSVYCLIPFRVILDGQIIDLWPSKKAQLVFKYLLTHRSKLVPKEVLMDIFWPEAEPEAARRNLHQAIYSLRQTLGRGQSDLKYVLFERDGYRLNPDCDIWLDSHEFEKHFLAGQELEDKNNVDGAIVEYQLAEAYYQDHYLAEDVYEDWIQAHRQYYWDIYLGIALRLARYHLKDKEFTLAVGVSQRIVLKDNCQEEAHQILIKSYLALDQRHLAMRQYQQCVQALKEELNLNPSAETQALYHKLTFASL
jgi:DNA-binding SARP family transcriptional activator